MKNIYSAETPPLYRVNVYNVLTIVFLLWEYSSAFDTTASSLCIITQINTFRNNDTKNAIRANNVLYVWLSYWKIVKKPSKINTLSDRLEN